ncbi:MAG: hypothetical protein LC777_00810 [Actinobacteria bacterium]|nr:hypothetical protein [Actinomycetota bacterium]
MPHSTHEKPSLPLRHSHASAWIAAGGDLVELSARLGHANPAITASVYSHEFESARRSEERTARLDAIYGTSVGAKDSEPQHAAAPKGVQVADLQARRKTGAVTRGTKADQDVAASARLMSGLDVNVA